MMAFREASLLDLRGTFRLPDLEAYTFQRLFGDQLYRDIIPIDEEHVVIHTDTSVFLYAHSTREKLWEIICPSLNFAIHLPHNLLALAPDDRKTMLWDLCTGQLVHQLTYTISDTAFAFCPRGLAFNHDGSILATGMEADGPITNESTRISEEELFLDDESPIASPVRDFEKEERSLIALWDTSDGHVRQTISMTAYDADITALTFHPSGSLLAVGSFNDRTVWLWNMNNGSLLTQWEASSRILQLAFSPDGKLLFVAAESGGFIVWDVEAQQVVTPTRLTYSIHAIGIAVDPSGRFLALCNSWEMLNRKIQVLEIRTWKTWATFTGGLDNPCFSLNGDLLGCITTNAGKLPSAKEQAHLIDVKTGRVLWYTLEKDRSLSNEEVRKHSVFKISKWIRGLH